MKLPLTFGGVEEDEVEVRPQGLVEGPYLVRRPTGSASLRMRSSPVAQWET
jgi:hypothetical protein